MGGFNYRLPSEPPPIVSALKWFALAPLVGLLRRLVLENRSLVGSMNAARDHYQIAVDDLNVARLRRGGEPPQELIMNRHRYTDFATAMTSHEPAEIKP
jgi:hypothetical protein